MTPTQIACVCHQANRALCEGLDDTSQPEWNAAPEWQRSSAVNGVNFALTNPDASQSDQHESWLAEKLA